MGAWVQTTVDKWVALIALPTLAHGSVAVRLTVSIGSTRTLRAWVSITANKRVSSVAIGTLADGPVSWGNEDMKHSVERKRGGVETWTSSTEARINHDCVEADRTWATTPFTTGICSAR